MDPSPPSPPPPSSNPPLESVAERQYQSESKFEMVELIIRRARRTMPWEWHELEFILGTEPIQFGERSKILALIRHLRSIDYFLRNLDRNRTGISDLVSEIMSVVNDLFIDTEKYVFDDCFGNFDKARFLQHFNRVENIVHDNRIKAVKDILVGSARDLYASYVVYGEVVIACFEVELREMRKGLTRGPEKLEVISIIGMAGIGKTTLAHMLYDHPSILYRFSIRAWISLSGSYEKKNILHDILRCIVPEDDPVLFMSVDDMGEKVYNCLSENRYLIIIDNIWDVQSWNELKSYFPENLNGSRILITSRIENVAFQIGVEIFEGNSRPYYLPRLTYDKSWQLFQRMTLFSHWYIPERLKEIGKEIVAKCEGLPLLIVVIARLLLKKEKTEKYWRQVAGNMSLIICKIMDSPSSNHIPIEMLVDHQFITIANRAVEFELENLEMLLDHESTGFGENVELFSLVLDLKLIYRFIRNVQETPTTLRTLDILDFVHEIKSVVEYLLDDTDSYIRAQCSGMKYFLRHSQKIAEMVPKIKSFKKDTFNSQGNGSTFLEVVSTQEACSSSVLEEKIVIGFEDQQKELLDKLIGGWKQLEVIAIIGMAGIGKTTMANMLYNHLNILSHFHVRAWTSLSQSYRKKNLLHDILSSIVSEDDPVFFMSEDDMGEKLYKSLIGYRYLIVIDDIWDIQAWNDVERYFPKNENGSRILMTSRIEDLVSNIRTKHCPYFLQFLSEDKSRDLFQCKVFGNGNIPGELEETGKKIVARCKGLPLAIVVIAGLLSKEEKTERCWRHVVENMGSSINNDLKQVMDIVSLSYKHLSSSLKSCFLYLGLFPEDSEIHVSTLIRSWIAEGFIQKTENRTLEEVAEEILRNLVSRNLVMIAKKSTNGGIKSICIHDLLRDMCLHMDEEKSFVHLVCGCASNSALFYSKALEGRRVDRFSSCQYFHFYKSNYVFGGEISNIDVLSVYKFLQVLDLRHVILFTIPSEILELLHLKFLALQVDRIVELPSTIFDLWNLETFILKGEKGVKVELEPHILKMNKLRHFQISQELFCDESKWMKALRSKLLFEGRKHGEQNLVGMIWIIYKLFLASVLQFLLLTFYYQDFKVLENWDFI